MIEKRPIDLKRNSAGNAEIGTKEDGAILDMIKIGERLLVIKERSVFEFMFADSIDPERTNLNLPNNIQKQILTQGADSEIVSRTLLTSIMLFKAEYFEENINIPKVLTLSLELVTELIVLENEIKEYLLLEENAKAEYEQKRNLPTSYVIPSIEDVETRCKTIFQKANHIEQILIEITTQFYSHDKFNKQSHFPKLHEVLNSNYGQNDAFVKFIDSSVFFMRIIYEIRNGLDHRLPFVNVMNFELQVNSDIISPTIELNHKEVKLKRESLSSFLPIIVPNMLIIFENTVAFISNKKVKNSMMNFTVKEIPEEKRKYKLTKYCFWSPLGEGGFYSQ